MGQGSQQAGAGKNVEQGGIVTGTGHNSVTWSTDGKEMPESVITTSTIDIGPI
jgi:hypothetical protein